MKLAGDLADFSLADLLQVHAAGGKTCCIKLTGPSGPGFLFLFGGQLVHAQCGHLTGEDALVALLAKRMGFFQVDADEPPPARTLERPLPNLLLVARERIEAGDVPANGSAVPSSLAVPSRSAVPSIPPPPPSARAAARSRLPSAAIHADQPEAAAARPAAAARRPSGRLALALTLAGCALVLGLAIAWAALRGAGPGMAVPAVPAAAGSAIEAADLTTRGDRAPRWLAGDPPPSPDPTAAVQPTIVCRLRIGVDGAVREARIYRSRLEFERFEAAALEAVRGYRFTPGLRAGKPVEVWINWPVSFR